MESDFKCCFRWEIIEFGEDASVEVRFFDSFQENFENFVYDKQVFFFFTFFVYYISSK